MRYHQAGKAAIAFLVNKKLALLVKKALKPFHQRLFFNLT